MKARVDPADGPMKSWVGPGDRPVTSRVGPSELDELVAIVEALLYAAEGPLSAADLLEVVDSVAGKGDGVAPERVDAGMLEAALAELTDRHVRREGGLQVVEVAGGFRLGTRPRYDSWVRALRQVERPTQLSMPALETLAVVAYRQPVTLAEIASVRGVDPAASLRTLREQALVRVVGRKRAVGRPFTYGTTRQFLLTFGLRGLDELPAPAEFEELLEG